MEDKIDEKKIHVSSSQFTKWLKCPHWWMLDYVKGLKKYEDSINTCFGTAMHETVQLYIKTLYTEGVEKADSINLYKHFKEIFERELTSTKLVYTEDDYTDFVFDGEDILKAFSETSVRIKNFPSNKYEFIDVELEIDMPIKNNVISWHILIWFSVKKPREISKFSISKHLQTGGVRMLKMTILKFLNYYSTKPFIAKSLMFH